jgi:hypothetical protein
MMDDLEFTRACEEFVPPENEFTPIAPEKFNGTTTKEKQTLTNRFKKAMMFVTGAIAAGVISISSSTVATVSQQPELPNKLELEKFFGEVYDMLIKKDTDYKEINALFVNNRDDLWLQYQEFYDDYRDENPYFYYLYIPKASSLKNFEGKFYPDEEGMVVCWFMYKFNSEETVGLYITWCHLFNDNLGQDDVFIDLGKTSTSTIVEDVEKTYVYNYSEIYVAAYEIEKSLDSIYDIDISKLKNVMKNGGYTNIDKILYEDSEEVHFKYPVDENGRFVIYYLNNCNKENLFDTEGRFESNKIFEKYESSIKGMGSLIMTDDTVFCMNLDMNRLYGSYSYNDHLNALEKARHMEGWIKPGALIRLYMYKGNEYYPLWPGMTEDDYDIDYVAQ